jgi:hypothetical protein
MTETTLRAIAVTRLRRSASPTRKVLCVYCSGLRESHHADGRCKCSGGTSYATMALADGVTCADCVHVERCCSIFGQLPEDQSCQFYPVRFLATQMRQAQ